MDGIFTTKTPGHKDFLVNSQLFTLLKPAADGRPSPTMSLRRAHEGCRRRPTTGTKCLGRTISIGLN